MKKILKNNLNKKRGSELTQFVLITGIMAVIVVSVFFPVMKEFITESLTTLAEWFNKIITGVTLG